MILQERVSMRIAYVINNATYTSIPIEMANILSKTDEVTLFSLYDSQEMAEQVCKEVAPAVIARGFDFKKNKLEAFKRLRHALLWESYDIVHTHQTFSGSLTRWILAHHENTHVVHTVHANHHSFSQKQNITIGSSLPFCDLIVFNSESSKKGLLDWQKRIIKKVPQKVIYNGIDVKRIQNADNQSAKRICEQFGVPQDAFVFAQIGRLETVKNPILSMKAYRRFLELMPDLDSRMIFIGDGSKRTVLLEYIESNPQLRDRVIFTGTLRREEVYSMLHRINAMLVPSLNEGFCNALFEGMAAGIPIAAANIEVFNELIDNDLGIRKFDNSDENALADEMISLIRNKSSQEVRCRWKAVAYERFDIERCISRYREAYLSILSGGLKC